MKIKVLNNKKMIILIAIILLLVILITLIVNGINSNNSENQNTVSISFNKSEEEIRNIIEKSGGNFIRLQESAEKGFSCDIYLYFAIDLFDKDGNSQEFAYTNLINSLVKNEKKNIRLIDTSRDITIRVYYNSDSDFYYYTINGEENYFENHLSQKSLENYKKIPETELTINSNEINEVIKNNWNVDNTVFGTKDSLYRDYDIFHEEGIKVKRISGDIFNIVFNKNYSSEIVNGLRVGDSKDNIEKTLGKSNMQQGNIIGYKNKDIYVFFSDEEVSVYRCNTYKYDEFESLLRDYIDSKISVKEFTNSLTYLWDDYVEYNYDSNYVSLNYNSQGVSLYLTRDDPTNVTIYNNYNNLESISDLIGSNKITAELDTDGIFSTEISRLSNEAVFVDTAGLPEYTGNSERFVEIVNNNNVEFKAKDETKDISCRLTEPINSYLWFSDTIFIYSIQNKGIFYFDLETRTNKEIITGNQTYDFNSFENGILNYDDNENIEIGSD